MGTATENVIGKVVAEARKQLLSSLEDGLKQAYEILGTAEGEATMEASTILLNLRRQIETERRKILGGAEVAARNKTLQLVEDTINKAFEAALQQLVKKMSFKEYEEAFKNFLQECVDALASKDIVVSANSKDLSPLKDTAKKLSDEMKIQIKVDSKPIKCVGGIRAKTSDGSVLFDNTVEARLARWKPLLRKQIAELLVKGG